MAISCALLVCATLRAGYRPASASGELRLASLWPDLSPPQTPHPAVVRVIAPEGATLSLGSGTLVDKNDEHGLVVTNWHVVRDARGPVEVVFPCGFRSTARVVRMDRDWDLAALLISKPPVEPVPLSTAAPKPGDALSIAGYGSGKYRMQSGRCTQYLSPGGNKPYEMIEMSAAARQGDSGGPILNQRGELAGVLFGAGDGKTSGSYGGRVHQFLQLASMDLQRSAAPHLDSVPPLPPRNKPNGPVQLYANHVASPQAATLAGQIYSSEIADPPQSGSLEKASAPAHIGTPPVAISAGSQSPPLQPPFLTASKWLWTDELKSLLAAFGAAAILLQVLRSIAAAKS